ncbi:MAG: hypothetical protein CVU39_28495 [Chloroflexi bacterium HGW-Chloroflexi-10]|nr:MAG: hypothetical protein CVU39_28495 [Chloroflexi bacterium HGW-Chloroflexi-10]
MNFQSGLVRKGLFLVICVCLAGCEPAATHFPPPATSSPISPTLSPVPPSATMTLTNTPHPTWTSIPTSAPYGKIPEQTDDGWQTTSLVDAGIDPVQINNMLDSIYHGQEQGDTLTLPNGTRKMENIHSILIAKDGRLVFEEYFYYYTRNTSHDPASVTKSITSLLVGLAIEQGYIGSVQNKILAYFPEYLPFQGEESGQDDISIEDLLTMRTGLECDDWDPASRTYYNKPQPDRLDEIKYILNIPMVSRPGSVFSYCTMGTTVLNALLSKTTGVALPAFATQFLLQPLGINNVVWDGSSGEWKNVDGVTFIRPRQMAKIGQLVLQNGNWNGKQILPQDWIEQSTLKHVSLHFNDSWGNGYGYLWWLSEVKIAGTQVHSISASGHGGQVITIFPDLNMVVVITGGNYENDAGQPFENMERFILPAVLPAH